MRRDALYLLVIGALAGVLAAGAVGAQPSGHAFIVLNDDFTWQYAVDAAPTATATHPAQPTPTPEIVAPRTPSPSPSATPQPGRCYGTVTDYLRVRAQPGGAYLGTLQPGDVITLDARQVDDGATWYRLYWQPGVAGWSHGDWIEIAPEADCSGLDDGTVAALMFHAVNDASGAEMLAAYAILNAKGIAGGVKPYADTGRCIEALESGNICIYRTPPDCPNVDGDAETEARQFMSSIAARAAWVLWDYRDTGRLWIEPTNECDFDSSMGRLYWWNTWMLAAIDYAVANHWPPLALPGLGPGYGDARMFSVWQPALTRLAESGGLLAMHAYTPGLDAGLCVCDQWLACRHRTNHATLLTLGIDLRITLTEAARGWGNESVSVADFACWYNAIATDAYLHSVALWTAGHHGAWPNANLNTFMIPIARAVG